MTTDAKILSALRAHPDGVSGAQLAEQLAISRAAVWARMDELRQVGFAIAVANARERVKAEAHYVTPNAGGYGAGRDAVEFILEAQGTLDQCIEAYIDDRKPISPSIDNIGRGGTGLK